MARSTLPSEYLPGFDAYETLRYRGRIDFADPSGDIAYFSRFQQIRFLENGISYFVDRVWGEGLLFSFYAAHGLRVAEVIRAKEGFLVVLALPRTFNRGEVLEIKTRRRLIGGFPPTQLFWDTKPSTPAEKVAIKVVAPEGRRLVRPELVAPLHGQFDFREQPKQLIFGVKEPEVGARYRVAWSWK